MRLIVIDNYDSFTWNLVHYCIEVGAEVQVRRNDAISAQETSSAADAVLISPGPGTPDGAGVTLEAIGACARAGTPLLGVCLGHQAIGQHFGGRVVPAPTLMHGKTSQVAHDGTGLFADLPTPITAARYHSLCIDEPGLPACLTVSARADDGAIMAVAHRSLPIHGVQFHPESIASEHGHALLGNFLRLARDANRRA